MQDMIVMQGAHIAGFFVQMTEIFAIGVVQMSGVFTFQKCWLTNK